MFIFKLKLIYRETVRTDV